MTCLFTRCSNVRNDSHGKQTFAQYLVFLNIIILIFVKLKRKKIRVYRFASACIAIYAVKALTLLNDLPSFVAD